MPVIERRIRIKMAGVLFKAYASLSPDSSGYSLFFLFRVFIPVRLITVMVTTIRITEISTPKAIAARVAINQLMRPIISRPIKKIKMTSPTGDAGFPEDKKILYVPVLLYLYGT
jgi:hypothetical protein